ncbi:hypothetical protein HG531_007536 [Fusarium graminearum]|nr:hypothetical protein HG531_007536 [Fusarium graminearum]
MKDYITITYSVTHRGHRPRPSPTTRPSTGDQASPPAQTLSPSTLQPPPRASLPRRSGDAPAATEGPTRQTSMSGGHLEVCFTLSLVGGNDGRATETRDNGTSTVVTALTGTFLEFLGDVDGQDRGQESSDESELHGESFVKFQNSTVVVGEIDSQPPPTQAIEQFALGETFQPIPILHFHTITNAQKVGISLQCPATGRLTPDCHRKRGHDDNKAQNTKLNEAVLQTSVNPVAAYKGEDGGNAVVDDSDAYHTLEHHVRVTVSEVRDAKITSTAVPKADEAKGDIRNGPVPMLS